MAKFYGKLRRKIYLFDQTQTSLQSVIFNKISTVPFKIFARNTFVIMITIWMIACSAKQSASEGDQDSSAAAIVGDSSSVSSTSSSEDFPAGLLFKDNETFFKALAEKKFIEGELIDISFITEDLVSVDENESVQLSVALIQSGVGEYSGAREGVQYATIHCMLVVFNRVGGEQVFRDFLSLGDVESQGLVSGDIEAEEIKIAEKKTAVMIHFRSSEEGAGDYGFRKDDAALYVFVKSKLASVLEMNLEDFQFTSDEQGSYSERRSTTEFKVLESKTNGFNDFSLFTSITTSSSGEAEPTEGEEPESAENESMNEPAIYKWDGTKYVIQ